MKKLSESERKERLAISRRKWRKNSLKYKENRKKFNKIPRSEEKKKRQSTPEYKEKIRIWQVKTRFGLTKEQYLELYAKQNYCCAICGKHEKDNKQRLAIDHNHITNTIRGLLCSKCNSLLGYVNEDIKILENAIKYLEIWRNHEQK